MAIIRSLLDLDFYKLTMAQLVWSKHPAARVTYAFKNRTKKVRLADIVSEADLRRELDHVRTLRFAQAELDWLRKQGMFEPGFLERLEGLKLPPYELAVEDGQFRIEVTGRWLEAIWWETLILSIVNELYYRAVIGQSGADRHAVRAEGKLRLERKLRLLRDEAPLARIIEFGTRRRFSRDWQEEAIRTVLEICPDQLLGTSNVRLARKFGLKPIGTFAHELYMVYSGIYHRDDDDIRRSHNRVIRDWWEMYGGPLSIALTDTYGSDFFFRDFTRDQAEGWRGLRQDSGDPVAFGERTIGFYRDRFIDPKGKVIVFSDGLDEKAIIALHQRFAGRIGLAFGWGTNLTNDLGFAPLSLVVKVTRSCGHPTVKLSDTLAKAMGPAEEVERYVRIFGYAGGSDRDCVY